MAMTFALRYRWWVVLGGITVATTAVHLISVAVGHYLGAALPTHLLGILAGVAFVLFGLWTLRGDKLSDDEATRAQRSSAPAFFAVTSAFLLAELGDKTMLATVTLAADHDWVGVWIGSTLGMVAADALAIMVGAIAGKHLPERVIQLVAAALFLVWMRSEIAPTERTRSVGAISERIHTPRSAREDTLRAVNCALRDRRTVVLSLPLDVQNAVPAINSA